MTDKKGISAKAAYPLFKDEKAILIDVREPEELEDYSVAFAANIPLKKLPSRLKDLPKDKTIITTCASGHRAQQGCEFLTEKGFESKYIAGPIRDFAAMAA